MGNRWRLQTPPHPPQSHAPQLLRKTDETNRRADEILVSCFRGHEHSLFRLLIDSTIFSIALFSLAPPVIFPLFRRHASPFLVQTYKKRNEERRQQEHERKVAREREVEAEITKRQIERLQREARVRDLPFRH
jgi:hypothetical protein